MPAHYEQGSESKIAVVLSCPGKQEKKHNKPASGITGNNLDYLLNKLENEYHHSDFKREKITITNAWSKVEFKGKNGTSRSEPTITEVLGEGNLNRLSDEIKDVSDYIICCGKNAEASLLTLIYANKIHSNCKVIYIPHLSTRGLCKAIVRDIKRVKIKPRSSDGMSKRLDVVAFNINKGLKN
ncbi:uracil-DNA glycosylase family protein [Aeromonas hydrophila]|uniref:uracil-DNA glycosylase family protein n=1 Tax=Aeromonas hydrophila TaxID=644 RepID=UPI001A20CFA9|nr:uracil-DNA glycosylase family protein [Aeromonas hydrophila]MCP3242253.1 uracil-DNA glycosylase family protein [Aeromonas hydrophila]HAU4897566.1 hypothetical protein [Aeromonas hydrophila]